MTGVSKQWDELKDLTPTDGNKQKDQGEVLIPPDPEPEYNHIPLMASLSRSSPCITPRTYASPTS